MSRSEDHVLSGLYPYRLNALYQIALSDVILLKRLETLASIAMSFGLSIILLFVSIVSRSVLCLSSLLSLLFSSGVEGVGWNVDKHQDFDEEFIRETVYASHQSEMDWIFERNTRDEFGA